jgi:hypothetical protein
LNYNINSTEFYLYALCCRESLVTLESVDIPDLLDPLVFLDQREIREHLPNTTFFLGQKQDILRYQ